MQNDGQKEPTVVLHPFDPIVFDDSNTLILGSFPSIASFENSFYYAHPKNQFWPLLSNLFSMPTATREQKIELLRSCKIALWDMAASCRRANSSDSNLKDILPNDIALLLRNYPSIERVLFTGLTAQKIYRYHFSHLPILTDLLPSPSPAYAAISFEVKLEGYKKLLIRV